MNNKLILWIMGILLLSSFAAATDELKQSYEVQDAFSTSDNYNYVAMTWTALDTYDLSIVSIYAEYNSGTPTTCQNVYIWDTVGGNPSSELAYYGQVCPSDVSAVPKWLNRTTGNISSIIAGNVYAIVITPLASIGGRYGYGIDTSQGYTNGTFKHSADGSSWTTDAYDMDFMVWGTPHIPVAPTENLTVTASATASEQSSEDINFRFTYYNITAASNATLIYNNTEYTAAINHIDNNNATFNFTILTPLVYNYTENVPFYLNYTLVYANGTVLNYSTSSTNQAVIWNLTKNPRVNITASSLLNASATIYSFSVDNGTTYSTTSGNIYLIGTGIDEFSLDASGYAIDTQNITFIVGNLTNYNYALYTTNSFNLTFRDIDTNALILGNITLDIIGDTSTFQYNVTNGTQYLDLLIPEHYTFRYSTEGYNTNQYEYDLTNRTHNSLTFYSDNSTDLITVAVYDSTTLNIIPAAKVYLHKFDIDTGAYNTVSVYTTDPSGNAYFYVDKGDEYYKFSVDYPEGTRKLDTEKFYINSDTINLYISLTEAVGGNFYSEQSIDYTLVWDEANRKFIVNYVDSEAAATQYCLYVKEYGHYGATIHNTSCITSHAGSIELSPPAANSTYYAVFTANINEEERILQIIFANLGEDKLNAGVFGIFLTVVLIMIFAFMGTINIMALFFASAALAFSKLLGIIALGWGEIIAIFIVSLIISLVLHFKK